MRDDKADRWMAGRDKAEQVRSRYVIVFESRPFLSDLRRVSAGILPSRINFGRRVSRPLTALEKRRELREQFVFNTLARPGSPDRERRDRQIFR